MVLAGAVHLTHSRVLAIKTKKNVFDLAQKVKSVSKLFTAISYLVENRARQLWHPTEQIRRKPRSGTRARLRIKAPDGWWLAHTHWSTLPAVGVQQTAEMNAKLAVS